MRPDGRNISTSNISTKGIVAARLEIFKVINPPTCSAHSRAPNKRKQVRKALVDAHRKGGNESDQQRSNHRAFQRSEPAHNHHDEDDHAGIQAMVGLVV